MPRGILTARNAPKSITIFLDAAQCLAETSGIAIYCHGWQDRIKHRSTATARNGGSSA
jgi:hypothetical protein